MDGFQSMCTAGIIDENIHVLPIGGKGIPSFLNLAFRCHIKNQHHGFSAEAFNLMLKGDEPLLATSAYNAIVTERG